MFPITVAILPLYLFVRQLGLTNTLQAVIIVQAAFQVSGNMMILRSFLPRFRPSCRMLPVLTDVVTSISFD